MTVRKLYVWVFGFAGLFAQLHGCGGEESTTEESTTEESAAACPPRQLDCDGFLEYKDASMGAGAYPFSGYMSKPEAEEHCFADPCLRWLRLQET